MFLIVPKKLFRRIIFLLLIASSSVSVVLSQPVANFSGTPTSGCAPLLVTFTDNSTGNPTSWKWDLGNGTISFLQNPSLTYFTSGKYKITLTVTNSAGSNTIIKDQYINVFVKPAVAFSGNPVAGCIPLPVQFTDSTNPGTGTVSSWKWDFGDGLTSTQQNPQHTYNSSGTFNVTLQAINSLGCSGVASKSKYINIDKLIANFSNNTPNSCKPPVTLTFKNLSVAPAGTTYKWDFGDGVTSTVKDPSHSYTIAGNYTVILTATSLKGCSNTVKKIVTIGTVLVDFTSPGSICPGSSFSLINKSSPAPSNVLWTFGDGTTSDLFSPSKTYKNPGNYTIKLVADFGACKDSLSKNITVLGKQSISFSASDTSACKSPLTVNFTSNNADATNYFWDFGDGSSSTEQNPSHTYTALGNFDVKLISTSSLGCKDTSTKTAFIKIIAPSITFPDLPAEDCIPFTHKFSAQIVSADSGVSYQWDLGDGTIDNTKNPTHTYNVKGKYDISLTVNTLSGCTVTKKIVAGVKVGTKPTANFIASPLSACAIIPINFTDLSTGGVDQWLWNFGDGTSSTQKNPSHVYQDTGFQDVTLTARSSGCPDVITFSKYVYIKAAIAKFGVKNNCKLPFQKIFSDSSIGADTWFWDFGDGTTSTTPNNTHNYTDTGAYNVSLKVTNFSTGCEYTTTQIVYVIVQNPDFITNTTEVCRESPILFQALNLTKSRITNYHWSYYDGGFSDSRFDTISHIYKDFGIFDARLVVTDLNGCFDTILKPSFIKVQGPTAMFSGNSPGTCINKPYYFNDNSITDGTHPVVTWIWNYGDGTTETLTAPPFSHIYSQPGTYSVSLKIFDSNGCTDTITNLNSIQITDSYADFSSPDRATCPLKPVTFNSTSKGSNLIYKWDFGDGATSGDSTTVHQYSSEGSYSISLTITDEFGCTDSVSKPNYILAKYPKADFALSDSISACPPFFVTFKNLSSNYDSLHWDFGDGNTATIETPTHFYYTPGTYIVRLMAISPGGCISQKTAKIVVNGPTGVLSYTGTNGCNTLETNFSAVTKNNILFIWDFNDGKTVKTSSSTISHTYLNPGLYLPKLVLEDENGCQVPIKGNDTIKVITVFTDFNVLTKPICDSGSISFKDSSSTNGVIVKYLWDFGDGSSSSVQSPDHIYTLPGAYTVRLKTTTFIGCEDSISKKEAVHIVASPEISISANKSGCALDSILFKGVFLKTDTSNVIWKWDFDNGNTSTLQNPLSQVYPVAGNYLINATATNSTGCIGSADFPITINVIPAINAGNDTILCQGSSIQLNASGGKTYQWQDPKNFLTCTNCANPVTNTPDDITYVVKGTNEFGCFALDSVLIKVKKPFTISISPSSDSICTGQQKQLKASYADNYLWTPSSNISSTTINNPIVSPTSTTTYKVVGYDNNNCFKDSAFTKISVFQYPTVDIGPDKEIANGASVKLTPKYSSDIVSWLWTPNDGLSCVDCPSPVAMPNVTTQYILQVKNNGNCTLVKNITIVVNCNNLNLFIPNTFSPNNDGSNDIFYPRGTGINLIRGMRIFSRWGQIIFNKSNFYANDPSSGWDGKLKGTSLPPDVYTYVIDFICDNGNLLTQTGTITLLR